MLHVLQQLPLIPNEFHVPSATPRNMECNMKQPPDSNIIEQIVIALGPPRLGRRPVAAAVEMAIAMLRKQASQPFPDAASIRKAAENLRKAVEPLGDEQQIIQIPHEGCDCDGHVMTMRDLRSALDWFEHIEGPSSKVDVLKHFVASQADCLVNEFSQNPPTGTVDGQASEVASLLYQAVTGEEDVKLKHQVDAVRRSWRCLNLKPAARGR
jgi:hypothetical protein